MLTCCCCCCWASFVSELTVLARVVLCCSGRTSSALDTLASSLNLHRADSCVAVAGDVADPAIAQALVDAAVRHFGKIDAIVNNAALLEPIQRVTDADPAEWAELIRVNLQGPFNLTKVSDICQPATEFFLVLFLFFIFYFYFYFLCCVLTRLTQLIDQHIAVCHPASARFKGPHCTCQLWCRYVLLRGLNFLVFCGLTISHASRLAAIDPMKAASAYSV